MPTKMISLRIDEGLLKYLTERAEREHRTLTNMIVSILEREKERTHVVHELEYSEGQRKQIEELLETLYNTNSDNDGGNNHV